MQKTNDLQTLWSFYKYSFIEEDGRVSARDEGGITTSEGQSYGLLRSVWANDKESFYHIWGWTQSNLQVRKDKLFAWKWHGRVLDLNSATDADTDIALSLLLASRHFDDPKLLLEAKEIVKAVRDTDYFKAGSRFIPSAGNWTKNERYVKVHIGYLAPYAASSFASIDREFPWENVVTSIYDILHWIYDEQKLVLPPEYIFVDRNTGKFFLKHPLSGQQAEFSYDVFPLFWRIATDLRWFHRGESELRSKMIRFFDSEFNANGKLVDRYTLSGRPLSNIEALPLYPTIASLARESSHKLSDQLEAKKLNEFWNLSLKGTEHPYYFHNWLWFDRALELGVARDFDEFLSFLRPFDTKTFMANLQSELLIIALVLFILAKLHRIFRVSFLVLSTYLCLYYLLWRMGNSLNFVEPAGPFISILVLGAEVFGFFTLLMLWLQVGTSSSKKVFRKPAPSDFKPSVDIFIPIFSESLEILEATLVGAVAIEYPSKKIFVCDDSHRDSVKVLAEEFGATYIKGPKKHAKAGNLNNALSMTSGELIVVFDTDHIPVTSFLNETVPLFFDDKMGVVQTPHVFYNEDIFQRSFLSRKQVSNEQDMFNHAIQSGRDTWGGAFFVGSGAVFRRAAMDAAGGFNLLSITEDIHTCQKIHSLGFKSGFVDKNLAVGLSAENLLSYLVQRRRWMLGCLQIFFKDNPLKYRSIPLRLRWGYVASLIYFFFPLVNVIFWAAPMMFLLFHWHPLLADIPVLFAHLLPFMILRPIMTAAIIPNWPRVFWGQMYEMIVSFPLFRAMFDLFLPKNLGFKVTPKGITSQSRQFDFSSSRLTLLALAISVFAIGKGAWEAWYFGIEKEAYFFNMGWAIYNTLFLIVALIVAWERPQKRESERIYKKLPVKLKEQNFDLESFSCDISMTGIRLTVPKEFTCSDSCVIDIFGVTDSIKLESDLVYCEVIGKSSKVAAFKFRPLPQKDYRTLIKIIFTDPCSWKNHHLSFSKSHLMNAYYYWKGVFGSFRNQRPFKRKFDRSPWKRTGRLTWGDTDVVVRFKDKSLGGFSFQTSQDIPLQDELIKIKLDENHDAFARNIYTRKTLWGSFKLGYQFIKVPTASEKNAIERNFFPLLQVIT